MSSKTKPRKKKKTLGSYPFLTVVFSITLALFLIGFIGSLIIFGKTHAERIQEVELHVYLDGNITNSDQTKIHKLLGSKPYIKRSQQGSMVKYFSQKEMTREFIASSDNAFTEEDIIETAGFNPIKACFVITIEEKYSDVSKLNAVKKEIEKLKGVHEVDLTTQKKAKITSLQDTITVLKWVLLIVVTFSLLAIIILINNTIKLALFSQRFLIRSMQLVGATGGFIQSPFIKRSIFHGLIAGCIASGLILLAMQFGLARINDFELVYDSNNIFILLGALPIVGCLLGLVSTYRAISKYLKMSLDDLY